MKGSDFYRIEKAIKYLTDNAVIQPSLEDLSKYLGLSEYHCHRLFKQWAGITPKDFLQVITLTKAKTLLTHSKSVMETSFEVGLSGSSRLHDLFVTHESMTPGEYKAGGQGLEIKWGQFESPLGTATLAITDRGICALNFSKNQKEGLEYFQKSWPKAKVIKSQAAIQAYSKAIVAKMQGKPTDNIQLFLKGTPFQIKVWEALLKIPEGQISTYQEIAYFVGIPKAVRAVGTAVGANPIGYLIPCHRVIRSTGAVGEYHWGTERKIALLAMEKV